ncbi:amidohydrolase [Microvirga sp. BT350]|uniref:Amidohydrolase n=2 Tax=Microvirga alba TaxID=2791025 RepID=A0A931FQ57_9HYPH|nr:amidohydrolase [Microvirga alba]
MKIIDFRLRPPYKGFLNARIYTRQDISGKFTNQLGFPVPRSATEKSIDLMFTEMDEAGIDIGVVVGRNTKVLGAVPNTDVAEMAREFPKRLVAVASIDPADRKDAMRQMEEALALGMRGVNLEPGMMAEPMHLDDRRLYPIYAFCEDNDIPTILMGGGNAGPDISYTSPEHIDRVLGDFPNLKIVSSHGSWPWVKEIIHVAFRRPNLYLSPDMYLYNLPGMTDYIAAANGFLQDRFLFGTAYPLCPLIEYTKWFRTLPLDADVMQKVLYTNAARLLKIET